jgi:peptidyl-prolyl cis-trans isomerase B (cyclophilin B)
MVMNRWGRRVNVIVAVVATLVIIAGVAFAVQLLRRSSPAPAAVAELGPPCPTPSTRPSSTPRSWPSAPPASPAGGRAWRLTLETSCGRVTVALDGTAAPRATSALVFLAQQRFFDGTACHRLTTAGIYVLQCGDPTGTGTGGPGFTFGPVENAPADAVYPAGTVAMARTPSPNSQGSQFFVVYRDSTIAPGDPDGYTVVGRITGGIDIIDDITARGVEGGGQDGPPQRGLSITSAVAAPG